jgi:hypothetical protein
MILSPSLRKLTLAVHVVTSVGLLGSVAAFLVLAIAGLTIGDAEIVRGIYVVLDLLARLIIVPLAITALAVGLIESLGTRWGLIRHYWIIAKLVVTIVAIVVLLLQLPTIGYLAAAAAAQPLSPGDLGEGRMALVLHSGGGLLVLLIPALLSIYKPRGRTGYGKSSSAGQARTRSA